MRTGTYDVDCGAVEIKIVVDCCCAEPTDSELGEEMSAALREAVGRQGDAYLIMPPHQADSPRNGNKRNLYTDFVSCILSNRFI